MAKLVVSIVAALLVSFQNYSQSKNVKDDKLSLKPVFETKYSDEVRKNGIATAQAVDIVESNRLPEKLYMPDHPSAGKDGFVYSAAVNIEEEYVEMMEASRQYQNNVEVITTLRTLMMRTISMGK